MRYVRVATLDDAVSAIAALELRTVIVDVEPLVTPWDSGMAELAAGVPSVAEVLPAEVVVFSTNSLRRFGGYERYISNARKPFRVAPYRDLPRPGGVLGDQVATDGLLAWRLGYAFLHYCPSIDLPLGPRLMRALGRPLRHLLFRRRS
jgi:predicted HAD superfamily phosphohydrolase YqeG